MDIVEVFESEGKGRGLRASRELWAGDVLFVEASYAAVVFDRYENDQAPRRPMARWHELREIKWRAQNRIELSCHV